MYGVEVVFGWCLIFQLIWFHTETNDRMIAIFADQPLSHVYMTVETISFIHIHFERCRSPWWTFTFVCVAVTLRLSLPLTTTERFCAYVQCKRHHFTCLNGIEIHFFLYISSLNNWRMTFEMKHDTDFLGTRLFNRLKLNFPSKTQKKIHKIESRFWR